MIRTQRIRTGGLLLVAVLMGLVLATGSAGAPPDYTPRNFDLGGGVTVSIKWDSFGVPNVLSSTDSGAMHGWGYAMAVDRFFQMELARRSIRGRHSELLGRTAPGSTNKQPIAHDRNLRRQLILEYAVVTLEQMRTDHTQHVLFLDAFSEGVNRFLIEKLGDPSGWATDPQFRVKLEDVHPLFRKYPLTGDRFQPWEALDCLASQWFVTEEGTTNAWTHARNLYCYQYLTTADATLAGYCTAPVNPADLPMTHDEAVQFMFGSTVVDEEGVTVRPFDMPQALIDEIEQYAEDHGWGGGSLALGFEAGPAGEAHPKFSHGFVVGASRTTSGRSVLLGMPQLDVTKMLFEISVKGASFTSRGISFPGCPGYMVGFTDDLAWSITSAGSSPKHCFQLKMGVDGKGNFDPDTYVFDGQTHPVNKIQESIPYRLPYDPDSGQEPQWSSEPLEIHWGSSISHTNQSDPDGNQTIRRGVPIVTAWTQVPVNNQLQPGDQFAIMSFHHFDRTKDSINAYFDMLTAQDIFEWDTIIREYTTPSATMYVGDKDGNIGFWYLRKILLHSSDLAVAPLGINGAMVVDGAEDLPSDVIPIRYMPHVINPLNQLTPGVRDNIESIIICGNSGAVGSWYPLPVQGGTGDTVRSLRFRQILSAHAPDHRFTPEELLAHHYDDVSPFIFHNLEAAFYQVDQHGETFSSMFGGAAGLFIQELRNPAIPDWVGGGGHFHSEHPLIGGLAYVGNGFRHRDFPELTRHFGQSQSGRILLFRRFAEVMRAGGNLFDDTVPGNQIARDEVERYLNEAIGNGWTRATVGSDVNGQGNFEPLGATPDLWHDAYLERYVNLLINGKKSTGARFAVEYHGDLTGYGSLERAHDLRSGILHNPLNGVGAQASNFYSQWVHFRWHDTILPAGAERYAHAVYNRGNSLHPESQFFDNNQRVWERDGLNFDLDQTQQDPTRYVRESPLQ